MSSNRTAPAQRVHHANRRRSGFRLTQQRHSLPIFLLAALGALCAHLLIMRAAPYLYRLWERSFSTPEIPETVKNEDVTRIYVRQDIPVERRDADDQLVPEEPTEIEEMEHDPAEIDVLDLDIEELVMAPGDTNIPLPENATEDAVEEPDVSEFTPKELDMSLLGDSAMLDQVEAIAEPSPINSNSVVANVSHQPDVLEDAEGQIERELRKQAREGKNNMPGDTRKLSELMGMSNLGSGSGVARLGTDVLFAFNQCKLKNSARLSLLQLAALIHKNPHTRFIIEGHTDSIGSKDYNALLSLQRAAAVCAWLISNHVPVDNVYMRPCGSSRPLVNTKLPKEKQELNRRVEIHMRSQKEELPQGCLPATYPVDRNTSVNAQLKKGVRAPIIKD